MKELVVDIETNGLNPSVVWCIACCDVQTEETHTFYGDTLSVFNEFIKGYDTLIAHNGIGFDYPVLERLLGTDFSKHTLKDTLVMSRLANPQRSSHSLKAWGIQLGCYKGDYDDWSAFTMEMLEYCVQDTIVGLHTYKTLQRELRDFAPESIELEHRVQTIVQRQVRHGWLLDTEKAYDLLAQLKERKLELESQVHLRFRPKLKFVKLVEPKIKKDGTMSSVGLKFLGDRWVDVAGTFSRLELVEFNLGSRQQIGEYLQDFGWKPVSLTNTGQPIVDEKTLKGVNIPEAKMIAEYLLVQKRIAQVNSWLDALQEDGRVHGYVNTNGAVTGRMTHSSPNMAQVPAVYSEYGNECRGVWKVADGYKLVGCDASGLELRMLAHYMNDEEYTKEILGGDIHSANQRAAGLDTRDQAKTFIYAFLYGAGDAKIGSIVGGSARDGRRLKDKFLSNTPSLGRLRDNVTHAAARGYLKGLDGRNVFVRSEHAALNTLLQSAGAIVMKKALVILDDYATQWGLDYEFVGNIHDEFQAEVKDEHTDQFGMLAAASIEAAGIQLGLRCKLAGEYKVGNNWAETH